MLFTEAERNDRVKKAIKKQPPQHQQTPEWTFQSLGFDPEELGKELNVDQTTKHQETKGEKTVQGVG